MHLFSCVKTTYTHTHIHTLTTYTHQHIHNRTHKHHAHKYTYIHTYKYTYTYSFKPHKGECYNCRSGTMGAHCQSCSPHVEGVDCSLCSAGYWWSGNTTQAPSSNPTTSAPNLASGIVGSTPSAGTTNSTAASPCTPCDCSPVGALTTACDPATGACSCVHPTTVTGRACDRCIENYVNLTMDGGCSKCGRCYQLVGEQVDAVRLLMGNTTANADVMVEARGNSTTGVMNNSSITAGSEMVNSNSTIGVDGGLDISFNGQASTLQAKLQALTSYVTYVRDNSADIERTLASLNTSYTDRLLAGIAATPTSLSSSSPTSLSSSSYNSSTTSSSSSSPPSLQAVSSILQEMHQRTLTADASYSNLVNASTAVQWQLDQFTQPLVAGVELTSKLALVAVDRAAARVQRMSTQERSGAVNVATVSNGSRLASDMQAFITDASANNTLAYSTAVQGLSTAQGSAATLSRLIEDADANAQRAETSFEEAVDVGRGTTSIASSTTERISAARNTAYEINIAALQKQRGTPSSEIDNVAARTGQLTREVNDYTVEADALVSRSASAAQSLSLAEQVGQTARDAGYMLSTMNDFDDRATGMSVEVNASMGVVASIRELSLRVYNASLALKPQLAQLRNTSAESLARIRQASLVSSPMIDSATLIASRLL